MNFKEAYVDTCSTVGAMARCGDLLGLQNLVWNGKPVDVKDNRGWRPTHDAAYNDHPGCLEFLLRQEATDPNWETFEKETAMLLAARNGHTSCVRLLLNFNADPNLCTNEGFSPLWEALVAQSRDCIRLLVKRGAEVNCKTYTDYTPLHLAAEKGNTNIVAYFLNHGARLDVFTEHHLSPIFLASHAGQVETLRVLLKVASDRDQLFLVNDTAKDNASPLLIAAQEGHTECLELLLDHGADPNIQVTETQAVPLQYAIYKNNIRCVQLLIPVTDLTKVASCSEVDMHPLLLALKLKDTSILRLLLDAGFDIHTTLPLDPDDHPMLMKFMRGTHQTLQGSLLCHIEEDWPEQGVRLLLKSGLSPDKLSEHDAPPLVAMLCGENLRFCKLLLQFGANPNVYHRHVVGNLALIVALGNDLSLSQECRNGGDVMCENRFIWPLLLAGAEAGSLFSSRPDSNGIQTPEISIQNLMDEFHPSHCFAAFSSLMCFCHFLDIPNEILLKFTEKQRKHFKKISASTYTLAHGCRKQIVLELAKKKNYQKKKIESLGATVPVAVQEYLLFTEFEHVAQNILQINSAAIL